MRHNLETRLQQLERDDLGEEGEFVVVRVQYAANGDEPPTWGPTYRYWLGASGRVEEEDTPHANEPDDETCPA
jgi:hypothetical protein